MLINTVVLVWCNRALPRNELFQPGFCDRKVFEHKMCNKNVRFLMQRNRTANPQTTEFQAIRAIPNAKSGFQQSPGKSPAVLEDSSSRQVSRQPKIQSYLNSLQ